eukprot:CCRYP_018112-RA/>CCRYP_018112-RA protein AED:0.45 eAED:0.45 QI:0/0/0/1/0/0/2/0/85
MIFYAVDPNYIKSYPIKSQHCSTIIKAYTKAFIAENNTKFQYTLPDIHHTNPAEQAICTWKNHFVAICAGAPSTYCLSNWCKDPN